MKILRVVPIILMVLGLAACGGSGGGSSAAIDSGDDFGITFGELGGMNGNQIDVYFPKAVDAGSFGAETFFAVAVDAYASASAAKGASADEAADSCDPANAPDQTRSLNPEGDHGRILFGQAPERGLGVYLGIKNLRFRDGMVIETLCKKIALADLAGPLKVMVIRPADLTEGVPVTDPVRVYFSRSLEPNSAKAGVAIEGVAAVTAEYDDDEMMVKVTPKGALAAGTIYKVLVNEDREKPIRDAKGTAMFGAYRIGGVPHAFMTAEAVEPDSCKIAAAQMKGLEGFYASLGAMSEGSEEFTAMAKQIVGADGITTACCSVEAARASSAGILLQGIAQYPALDKSLFLDAFADLSGEDAPALPCARGEAGQLHAIEGLIKASVSQPEQAAALEAILMDLNGEFVPNANFSDTAPAWMEAAGLVIGAMSQQPEMIDALGKAFDDVAGSGPKSSIRRSSCVAQAGRMAGIPSVLEALARQPELEEQLMTKATALLGLPVAPLCDEALAAGYEALGGLYVPVVRSPDMKDKLIADAKKLTGITANRVSSCATHAARAKSLVGLIKGISMGKDSQDSLLTLFRSLAGPAEGAYAIPVECACEVHAARIDAAGFVAAAINKPESRPSVKALFLSLAGATPAAADFASCGAMAERWTAAIGPMLGTASKMTPEEITLLKQFFIELAGPGPAAAAKGSCEAQTGRMEAVDGLLQMASRNPEGIEVMQGVLHDLAGKPIAAPCVAAQVAGHEMLETLYAAIAMYLGKDPAMVKNLLCLAEEETGLFTARDPKTGDLLCVPDPFALMGSYPAEGETVDPTSSVINAVFNAEVDPETFEALNVTYSCGTPEVSQECPEDGVWQISEKGPKIVEFAPTSGALRSSTTYTVTISPALRDVDNRALGKEYKWSFVTMPLQ